jgi:hypothetical protein
MKLAFISIRNRDEDSTGRSLEEFKSEVGEEMIVELLPDGSAAGNTTHGLFVFKDPKESELSPYVSLDELLRVKFVPGTKPE